MVVKNLKVIIQSNNIINDISFTLNDGDKIGLVGNNGSGKTTLLKALSNNLPYIGSIKLNTEQVDYLKQEISYIYNELTVIQYIKQVIGIDSLENKLYELENLLGGQFMRISKSTILNLDQIYAITKSISNCQIKFHDSYKTVYVSRRYYRDLNDRLKERRALS